MTTRTRFVVTQTQKKATKTLTIPMIFCNRPLDNIRHVTLTEEKTRQQKTRFWASRLFTEKVANVVESKKNQECYRSLSNNNCSSRLIQHQQPTTTNDNNQHTNEQTNKQASKQANKHTNTQEHKHTNTQADMQTCTHAHMHTAGG